MATTTPNFGWTVPTSTDLVKDGATAIETLGDGIDASFVDLKGGTTGQVLSKASGTDLDFTWVAQDDSNAIQNTIVDAKGDLITATGSDTPARLAVGTNGQILTADSTAATGLKWATASTTSGSVLINTTSFSTSGGVNIDSIFSSTYTNYEILITSTGSTNAEIYFQFRTGGTTNTNSNYYTQEFQADGTSYSASRNGPITSGLYLAKQNTARCNSTIFLQNPYESVSTGAQSLIINNSDGFPNLRYHVGNFSATTSFDGIRISPASGTMTGTVSIYGMVK
jgi:hypothetical protein